MCEHKTYGAEIEKNFKEVLTNNNRVSDLSYSIKTQIDVFNLDKHQDKMREFQNEKYNIKHFEQTKEKLTKDIDEAIYRLKEMKEKLKV
jgi:predicted RNA-binding protein with RPS1 domain